MILRSAKIVVEPGREADTVPMYQRYTEDFTLRQPGSVAVRLFRDRPMPNKFILHSWWESEDDMAAAAATEGYARIIGEARQDFLERMSVWVLDVLDEDPRPLLPARADGVVSRLLKITLRPNGEAEMMAEYHRVTDEFTRRQPGCLRVQLFRDRHVRNVFFVQSYWIDHFAMAAALASSKLQEIRVDALRYLEERMTVWEMNIVVDDQHKPIFLATP